MITKSLFRQISPPFQERNRVQLKIRREDFTREQEKIELSAREFNLLAYMIRNRGAPLTRNQILDDVCGSDVNVTTRTVDVHIAWLRQKLETTPRYPCHLLTVHGSGYRFED